MYIGPENISFPSCLKWNESKRILLIPKQYLFKIDFCEIGQRNYSEQILSYKK